MVLTSRIPKGSTILLTGASGFVGSSIAQELLEEGFTVRGAGRDVGKFHELQTKFDRVYGKDKFTVVEIKDYSDSASLDKALDGVKGVIHTATDSSFGTDFDKVVGGTIEATLGLLRVAHNHKNIVSFILTSSRIASFNPNGKSLSVHSDTWLDEITLAAKSAPLDDPMKAVYVYAASKVEGEKAAWKFIKENKPSFAFNSVLPDYVMGKVVNPRYGTYSTNTFLNEFYRGSFSEESEFFQFTNPPSLFVDVVDVARAHVVALIGNGVDGERIFAMTDVFSVADVARAIHSVQPHHDLPDYSKTAGRSDIFVPNGFFKQLLKEYYNAEPASLQESVSRTILDA